MSIKKDILHRIMYHKDCMTDCEDHYRGVQYEYKQKTRSGLDEHQMKALLIWRKEEQAAAVALRNFHHAEKNWLAKTLKEYSESEKNQ